MRFIGLSGKQVADALKRAGFIRITQKGSHIKYRKFIEGKKLTVIVPNHKELKPSVVDSILEMAELTAAEFKNFIK